ncbi:reductase [Lentilactobacillus senioris]|uniref:reductase n=1 Tax=Lentilactobacillus senioris TaxID=931534 RepID=UPI0022823B71|nr:reductase [Lentilactobacillus senioris]MCY9806807.1 reductase [Lentilactobacillus senioris]
MLYQYRKDYEKVTMGLLSLIDNLDNMDLVEQQLNWYVENDNHRLWLYRDANNNWTGLVGTEERQGQLIVHQIVCTPGEHKQNTYNQMLNELNEAYPKLKIVASLANRQICLDWEKQLRE